MEQLICSRKKVIELETVSFVFFLFICGRFEKAILLPVASNPHSFESHRLCQLYFYPATNCIFILTKMYFLPLTGCFSTCQRLYFHLAILLVFSSFPKFSSKDVFLPSNRLHFNLPEILPWIIFHLATNCTSILSPFLFAENEMHFQSVGLIWQYNLYHLLATNHIFILEQITFSNPHNWLGFFFLRLSFFYVWPPTLGANHWRIICVHQYSLERFSLSCR